MQCAYVGHIGYDISSFEKVILLQIFLSLYVLYFNFNDQPLFHRVISGLLKFMDMVVSIV